jgi:hypothetical protein
MSTRTKTIAFIGVALAVVGAVAVLLVQDEVQPIGGLSRSDVLEIRAVVSRAVLPGWRSLTLANLRFWPTLARMRLTFRIVGIREEAVGTVTIHPDGTEEESNHPVTVRCRSHGWPEQNFRVERRNGGWVIAPHNDESPSLLFLTPKPRAVDRLCILESLARHQSL